VLAALLGGATPEEAARQAGVSEHTVRRRLHDPDFRARLDAAGSELVAAVAVTLTEGAAEAASALRGLLHAQSESVQLGAARALLEFAPKWRGEHADEERFAALERSVAELLKER